MSHTSDLPKVVLEKEPQGREKPSINLLNEDHSTSVHGNHHEVGNNAEAESDTDDGNDSEVGEDEAFTLQVSTASRRTRKVTKARLERRSGFDAW